MTMANATTTKKPPMDSLRKTALVAGALYLITFVAIAAAPLYASVFNDPSYIVSSGSDTALRWGAVVEIIVALACIGTAVVLYSVVKRQNEAFALGFVTTRVLEAALISIGVISLLSIATLHQDLGTIPGADSATLVIAGHSLLATYDWAFLLGQTLMPGMNAVLLGYVLYRSALVPRLIPLLGLIGGPLMISSAIGQIAGVNEQYSVWSAIALLPIFAWELSLGLWLVFKGFNRFALILAAPKADEGRPEASVAAAPSLSRVATKGAA
jgi:hypothetical protein